MIEPLPRAMRDYLAGFGLGCILVGSTGEISVAHNLGRMGSVAAMWWTRDRAAAQQVVRAIGAQRPGSVLAGAAAGASIDGLIERVFERTSVDNTMNAGQSAPRSRL